MQSVPNVAVGISPTLAAQSMGLSHQVEEYWTTLIKGANLIKCGRRGNPHVHFFRLSDSQDSLIWESKGRVRRVPLNHVKKILVGQQTQVFQKNKSNPAARGLEKQSMSLIYSHRQETRTLDLMCQTEEEFNLWYNALKYVWDQIRSRSTRFREHHRGSPRTTSQSSAASRSMPLGGGQSHGFANQNLGIPASRNVPGDCYIWGCAPPESLTNNGMMMDLVKVSSPHLVPSSQKLDIIHVSCGSTHFAAVTRSGHLYSWGSAPNGTLGLGSTQYASIPTTIPDMCCVKSVSCGETASAAITEDGSLYTWGCGLTGQLGHGLQSTTQYFPKKLPPFSFAVKIRQVSCGPYHSGAVCEGGGVYTWGDGFAGKLGHGNIDSQWHPKRVETINHVVGISCGCWHTAIVARHPNNDPSSDILALYTWGGRSSWGGDNNKGCLGNGSKQGEWLPYKVEGALQLKSIKQVACGLNLTVALSKDGEVYQMGTTGAEDAQVPWDGTSIPVRVEGPLKKHKIEQIACGKQHILAVTSSSNDKKNQLFSWGSGKRGQLGLGSHRDHTTPQLIEDLTSRKILNICCGGDYTLVVCSHDHKMAAQSINQTAELLISTQTQSNQAEASPTNANTTMTGGSGGGLPKRTTIRTSQTTSTSGGQIVNANQLRMPVKKTVLAQRGAGETSTGSMDHISISTCASIRKMKSDVFSNTPGGSGTGSNSGTTGGNSGKLDRTRTGSTPLSDAPSSAQEMRGTPRNRLDGMEFRNPALYVDLQRSQTPTSMPDDHAKSQDNINGTGNGVFHTSLSNPHSSSQLDGTESIVSEPGDGGTSSEDESIANTDGGPLTHDAYSEEEETSSQGRKSEKSMSSMDQGISKNLAETFRTPIMPFPPSADGNSSGNAAGGSSVIVQNLSRSQNPATTARLRSRQRGLERRLGIMDTWTSEQVISKHSSAPTTDLAEMVYQDKAQTAREEYRKGQFVSKRGDGSGFYGHRRSASAQNLFLSTLKEDTDLSKEQQMKKLLNYGKLLESVEMKLIAISKQQNRELSPNLGELTFLPKLLGASEEEESKIGSFFEVDTIEKTLTTLKKISDLLEMSANGGNQTEEDLEESTEGLKRKLKSSENVLSEIRSLIDDLRSLYGLEMSSKLVPTALLPSSSSLSSNFEKKDFEEQLRREASGSTTSGNNNKTENASSSSQTVHLWMEKVDPGVSIVFQNTGNCSTKIKKIRFAKRMFAWDEAQRWWENNQERLIKQYGLEPGYDPMQENQSNET